ncbi:MAG: DNA recombination protein RmuC [Bacteroidales bacterium]|nr:DNA recombination protein RmuC [Bacteroidales bacterium]
MEATTIIYVIISAIIGIAIGIIIGKKICNLSAEKEIGVLKTKLEMLENEIASYKKEYSDFQQKNSSLSEEKNSLISERDVLQKEIALLKEQHLQAIDAQKKQYENNFIEMQKRFEETIERVTAQMKNATNEMLKERQQEFADSSNRNLGQIINPLQTTIKEMKEAMDESKTTQNRISGEMKAHIEHMLNQSRETQKCTEEMTRAFKHGTKIQGDWGETIIDELLQSQGLTKGVHYDIQPVIKDADNNVVHNENGSIMRPDIILHLDTKRELIIDSKVSMTAFIDYVNAENEDDRRKYLKAHVDSIQKHVKELSSKNYSNYIQPPKVKIDYVIMFVPHSGALWTALNEQPDLWRKAMEQNVYIADEQTLYAALRIINLTWTQIQQAQNHEKVFNLAKEMLDRVGQFWKEYQQIGKALENAKTAYDKGEKKITDGGQSINTTAKKLIDLGAKQNDKNPLPALPNEDF